MNQILWIRKMVKPLVFISVLCFSSCSDLLENDDAFFHVATQEQQWNSLTDTRAALFGVYGLMRTALGENNTWVIFLCGCVTIYKPSVRIVWMLLMKIFVRYLIGIGFTE